MSAETWSKQDWFKNVLSKSGTDIMEIKNENSKDICKMVYYPSLPLLMKSEQQQQICTQMNPEMQFYQNNSIVLHPQSEAVVSNNATTRFASQNQSYINNIKLKQEQEHQSQNIGFDKNNSVNYPKISFKCEQCNTIFGSKSAHTIHMKTHSNQDNKYQNTSPSTSNNVQVTPTQTTAPIANIATPSDPYSCNVCKKTFSVPARLIRHYRTHTGERPFECEFCHKMFSVKENLQVHRRIHTKERPYKCDVCGRAFEHSGKLHRHMRIHTGERPHKCSVCSKTFIQSGQLVIHMRTHTGEKPYKCPVEGCGKGFTCSKQLKVHSRTHTGEKPYHCDICFRDFGYNHVLKLHRVQHYGSKCYKCTICDETFKSKKEMEAHIKGHSNDIPDDEDETIQQSQNIVKQENIIYNRESLPESEKSRDSIGTSNGSGSILLETPRESSSEANSENGEELIYNNMYERLERSGITLSIRQSHSRINPALLAAASIASQKVEEAAAAAAAAAAQSSSSIGINSVDLTCEENGINDYHQTNKETRNSTSPTQYNYDEQIAVMRQHGYFGPAPVAEYRPSLRAANDIVRRVEAAIAGAEPLLTPPRLSSTESPERSSSPESDVMMMADRDVMTLPLRKRKLYLKENQQDDISPKVVRLNVIQFARAS